ncbi:MAG: exodeoxyribonuclease VII small subunit [Chthoniobacteraceae bacterium]
MAKRTDSAQPVEHSFETAMQQLTEIVAAMESDQLPLEELIVRYEEGTKLVQVCAEKLKTAERKIEVITRNAQGQPETAEFEPEAQPKPKPAAKSPADVSLF